MDSFTAFKAMVALMSNSVMFDMFRMEERRTFHYIHVHDRILEFELPELHAHFQNSGIEAQMYAVDCVILAGGEERPWSPESERQIAIKFPEAYE
ncbi:hypothetical protein ATCC90586_008495 [Pythium insidiosum]|nr:hypothetical protein ATCC90586_008495 [Pythium insidiosum]